MPEISIIVPTYQAEKYLGLCVESILTQTFTDFEVILVDDGSTDGTADLCRRLETRDKRVRLLRLRRNKGVSAARNTGIMAARGKYIAFVDSDDLMLEDGFKNMYEAAERHHADIVDAQIYMQSDGSSKDVLEQEECLITRYADKEQLDGETLLPTDLQERMTLCLQYGIHAAVWKKIYRRAFLARYGLLFPSVKTIAEDFLFSCCCLFLAARYLRVPECFNVYCGNGASLTRKPKSERHLAMVLSSMMNGAAYLVRYLEKEPFFEEEPSRLEAVQQHWFGYCKRFHIYMNGYYQNRRYTRAADTAVKAVLRERFGAQADFVAYLFHTMNMHYAEGLKLLDENEKLKTKTKD